MKKIEIIYNTRTGTDAIKFLDRRVADLFEGFVSVEHCFLSEMDADSSIDADAYFVNGETLLYPAKRHIKHFQNVIVLKRSVNISYVEELLSLPKDRDILVVNDNIASTMEALNMLYELGFTSLNLIPFTAQADPDRIEDYAGIDYAITFHERQLVPPFITNVLDCSYREISFDSLLQLTNRIHLNNEVIESRLIKYLSEIVTCENDMQAHFVDNYIKSQIIDRILGSSPFAFITIDSRERIVFTNEPANRILHGSPTLRSSLKDYFDAEAVRQIQGSAPAEEHVITHEGINYLVSRYPLYLRDLNIGYYIKMIDAEKIRDIESTVSRKIHDKGLFAKHRFSDIIHQSRVMDECIQTAERAAETNHTLLLTGESGTEKELFAQSIHYASHRSSNPVVAINCSALPESLLESELFGYDPNSFTGSGKRGKTGLFEQANHGTIFLDEIADISPKMQSSLLRVLQERQIMRIGGDKIIDVDVRVIAATNRDLQALVSAGSFRNDLYYRLNVIPIWIPPLRNRREDILPLFQEFLGSKYENIRARQKEALKQYDWPGNVRELENASIYFTTFGTLPPTLFQPGNRPLSHVSTADLNSNRHIRTEILDLLYACRNTRHALGRTSILNQLRERDILISDGRLRNILSGLKQDGYITIGRGRQGTVITSAGAEWLHRNTS